MVMTVELKASPQVVVGKEVAISGRKFMSDPFHQRRGCDDAIGERRLAMSIL